jgi:hypothetical protein
MNLTTEYNLCFSFDHYKKERKKQCGVLTEVKKKLK